MEVLKVLYFTWVILWGFGCILGYFGGYNATFAGMLCVFVLLCLFPLLPYFYYLIYKKAKEAKNIFIAICYYLILFIIFCCYVFLVILVYLNYQRNEEVLFYLSGIIIHIIIFVAIYIIKRKSNESSSR